MPLPLNRGESVVRTVACHAKDGGARRTDGGTQRRGDGGCEVKLAAAEAQRTRRAAAATAGSSEMPKTASADRSAPRRTHHQREL